MDSERIEKLLIKYWDCQTSLEEEKVLRDYFSAPGYDAKFEDVAALFQYYTHEQQENHLTDFFDRQVLARIEKNIKPANGGSGGKIIRLFGDIAKVAAVVLVLVVAGYFINQELKNEKSQPYLSDTFEDPQRAFEETKKALALISENFNRGKKEVKKMATFNEAREKIKQSNL